MFLQLLPILSGILGASFDTLLKGIIKKNNGFSSATYLFLIYSMVSVFALPLILTHLNMPTNPTSWLALILAIASYGFAAYFFIAALKIEDISNVAIVSKITFVLTFIFGIIFFKEVVTYHRVLGIFIISLGIIVIFFEKKKFQMLSIKGLLLALLSGATYSVAAVFSKYALGYFSPYAYIFFIYIGLAILFFFFPKVRKESKQLLPKVKYLFPMLGLIGVFAYLTNLVSLKNLDLSFTYIVIGSVGTTVTLIYAIFLLKERKNLLNKAIGLACVLGGIFLLYKRA